MRSKQTETIPAGSIVIWDTFGELGQLYQLADAVFVGGSLAPLGGQNFLEPLALGKIPCCGPHLDNFAWALEPSGEAKQDSLEALGLLQTGKNAKAVAALLQQQLATPTPHDAVRLFAKAPPGPLSRKNFDGWGGNAKGIRSAHSL